MNDNQNLNQIFSMGRKKVLLFVFDGFADWEPAYALPEINKSGSHQVLTFALTKEPVQSMGGLRVIPDYCLEDIGEEDTALLILPGGTAWEEKKLREITKVVQKFNQSKIPIAAICAATTILADSGLLDRICHTSNAKTYLQSNSPAYRGGEHYKDQPAVFDSNIITASGTAPIEFAREILRLLKIFNEKDLDLWFGLFKNGTWEW